MLDWLPFGEAWVVDSEFDRSDGEPAPDPVCCVVGRELISGRQVRLWTADRPAPCPFDTGPRSLFVAHFSPAEWAAFEALGWPVPRNVIDTLAETRASMNGRPWGKANLTEAAVRYGVPVISTALKKAGQDLAQRGGPWSAEEREDLLDYCTSDVETNAELFLKLLPGILERPLGLEHALLRGLYMRALTYVDRCGVPVDVDLFNRLKYRWVELKRRLIAAVDADFGCYEGTTFRLDRFASVLDRMGVLARWPRTETGRLSTEQKVFKAQATAHPELRPLYELHSTLKNLRSMELPVGSDGRHRPKYLSPFGTDTGRNASRGSIFQPAKWIRSLIKPEVGRAVIYSDYRSQEIHVAARKSGDCNMIRAVESGDPYLWFARETGLAPADATKATHGALRDAVKVLLLGTGYGMGVDTIAASTGSSISYAEMLLSYHRRLFPTYWAWSEDTVYRAIETGGFMSDHGWPMQVRAETTWNTMVNHPIQAAGADILRAAVIDLVDAGIDVCMPVHDALLTECALEDLDEHVATVERVMLLAAEAAIGWPIPVEHVKVRYPDRYADERGVKMFRLISRLLDEVDARLVA